MAVAGEVGANTTVGTVGSSAARHGALDNDVADDALVDVELGSLSVGLEVDDELTLVCLLSGSEKNSTPGQKDLNIIGKMPKKF